MTEVLHYNPIFLDFLHPEKKIGFSLTHTKGGNWPCRICSGETINPDVVTYEFEARL